MINEATYRSAHAVDKIYKNVIKPYMQKPGQRIKYVDITPYVKSLIGKYTEIAKVRLRLSQGPSPEEGFAFLHTGGKKIDLGKESQVGKKSISLGDIRKFTIWLYGLYNKKITHNLIHQIKDDLTHEITHLIDVLRREGEYQKFTARGGYLRLPDEMNAAIHELKRVRKRERKEYDEIDSVKDLIDYFNDSDNDSLIRFGEQMEKPKWQKKIFSRMYRERLLPKPLMLAQSKKMNLPEGTNMKLYDKIKQLWEAKKKKKLKLGEKRFAKSVSKKKNPKDGEIRSIDKKREKIEKSSIGKELKKRSKGARDKDAYYYGTLRKILQKS